MMFVKCAVVTTTHVQLTGSDSSNSQCSLLSDCTVVHLQLFLARTAHLLWTLNLQTREKYDNKRIVSHSFALNVPLKNSCISNFYLKMFNKWYWIFWSNSYLRMNLHVCKEKIDFISAEKACMKLSLDYRREVESTCNDFRLILEMICNFLCLTSFCWHNLIFLW